MATVALGLPLDKAAGAPILAGGTAVTERSPSVELGRYLRGDQVKVVEVGEAEHLQADPEALAVAAVQEPARAAGQGCRLGRQARAVRSIRCSGDPFAADRLVTTVTA